MDISKRLPPFAVVPLLTLVVSACSGGGAGSVAGSVGGASAASNVVPQTTSTLVSSPSVAAVKRAADIPAGELALSADSLPGDVDTNNNFIDSIGANIKIDASTGPYANYSAVKSALLNLGIRHIRDGFRLNNTAYESELADLATSGIHSELVLTISPDANNNAIVSVTGSQAAAYLQAGHYLSSIEGIEGLNEPDVNQAAPNGPSPNGWVAAAQSVQKDLYTSVAALTPPAKKIPVYGPSVATNPTNLQAVGDLSQYMDFGNVHDYSGGYDLTGASIDTVVANEATLSGSKPIYATENGYSTGTTGQGMPDTIMLDYAQRLFFKQFAHKIKRTLWYEFLDENTTPNDYWRQSGLLTSSLTPKLAYTGLKNVISLLKDPTPYRQRTSLNFSFGGVQQFENIEHLLLQKNDGSFWLVVWRDVGEWNPAANGSPGSLPAPAPATISNSLNFLGTYVSSITEYDEDATGSVTNSPVAVSAGTTAQVSVGARPRIYKIVPGVAPVAPSAPVISNPTAHWSLDDASGGTAVDSVSSTGNFSVLNSAKSSWISGKYNSGLNFYGTQAQTNGVFLDTTQSYSATAWVQMNNLSGYQAAVAVNGVNQAAFAIDYTPQSNLSFTTYTSDSSSTGLSRIGTSFVPVIGQWYPIAVTYNASTRLMSLYVNGTLQSTCTAKSVFKATGSTEVGSMMQGGVGHYQWWNGGIDEVNLYQRELTAAEVKTLAGQ